MLRDLGAVPVVLGVREEHSDTDAWRLEGVETHLVDRSGPASLVYAPALAHALKQARLDLLHLHGIWQYPTHAAGAWAKDTGKPLVISPHGMLDPWITQRNAWKKHLARLGWERTAWHRATVFHALTDAEGSDIKTEAPGAQIATIPNPAPPLTSMDDYPRGPNALYLGRIHEKKNIAALISGWIAARPDLPEDATLTIAGWGDDEGIAMLEQAMKGQTDGSVEFVGTAFGAQKAALFDLSRFLVLPSVSEGLPMAILEAWSAGVPTIQSAQCHMPEGPEAGAAILCGTDTNSIREALITGLNLDDTRWKAMAQAAQSLARGPFSAQTVAGDWGRLYSGLLAGDGAA